MIGNKQQQGIILEKPLVSTYTRPIGVEIGETLYDIGRLQKKLSQLRERKRAGFTTVEHWKKTLRINGISIGYKANGLNRKIYYETSVEESTEKFNSQMKKIMDWLIDNGYGPQLCKRLGKFEMGKGVTCDLGEGQ